MGVSPSRQSASVRTSPLRDGFNPSREPLHASNSSQAVQEEYPHLGNVVVNLSWLNPNSIRSNDDDNEYIVTARGGIFFGNTSPSSVVVSELDALNIIPREYTLLDSRAHQLLIAYEDGWHAIASPEVFSRHTGTCLIIGDRTSPGRSHEIKLGDCFRLGSVGVVVSEVKRPNEKEERLDTSRLEYLREEALSFDHIGDEAVLAIKEESGLVLKGDVEDDVVSPTTRENTTGNLFCYMCYESHDTPDDHLVAPCACKGDTRYLHVQCLQKWYQSSLSGWRSLVIRTTGSGAPACKICGMAYKTTLTNLDGVKTNLLEGEHPGPYVSLVVVTRHDTSPELFNTKFRLHFGPGYRVGSNAEEINVDPEMNPSELTIGRSSMCNMVLDYRTVSTIHAKLAYHDGAFMLQDASSSNGTMLYLQGPLKLPQNQSMRLRMGRSTLTIQARRSLAASFRNVFSSKQKKLPHTASIDQLQKVMAMAPSMVAKPSRAQEKSPSRHTMANSQNSFRSPNFDMDGMNTEARRDEHQGNSRSNSPRPVLAASRDFSNIDDHAVNEHSPGNPSLDISDDTLREIFRNHQSLLPQGYVPRASSPRQRVGQSASNMDAIDSPLILGDRPRSQQGSQITPPRVASPEHSTANNVSSSLNQEGRVDENYAGNENRMDESAAVTLPTTLAYNGLGSSPCVATNGHPSPCNGESSVETLVALTSATLNTLDVDGNPLVNRSEFLLQLDDQLQSIETCVAEATAMAVSSIGEFSSTEDRQREHAEMRAQRSVISQSIKKDERTGRNIVDNEAILLAATIISAKAATIAAITTGKESKKAEKVSKRYSIIADKANEMIIRKVIRLSVRNGNKTEYDDNECDDILSEVVQEQKFDSECTGKEVNKEEFAIIGCEDENLKSNEEKGNEDDSGRAGLSDFQQLREAQALSILEGVSSRKDLERVFAQDFSNDGKRTEEEEMAMAMLLQAAQAAVCGNGADVKVTGEDVDEVMKAIRDICRRRAEAKADSDTKLKLNENEEKKELECNETFFQKSDVSKVPPSSNLERPSPSGVVSSDVELGKEKEDVKSISNGGHLSDFLHQKSRQQLLSDENVSSPMESSKETVSSR